MIKIQVKNKIILIDDKTGDVVIQGQCNNKTEEVKEKKEIDEMEEEELLQWVVNLPSGYPFIYIPNSVINNV